MGASETRVTRRSAGIELSFMNCTRVCQTGSLKELVTELWPLQDAALRDSTDGATGAGQRTLVSRDAATVYQQLWANTASQPDLEHSRTVQKCDLFT